MTVRSCRHDMPAQTQILDALDHVMRFVLRWRRDFITTINGCLGGWLFG